MPAVWTTPRTWTAGELVTAAIGNSAWRDNLLYLKDSPTFDQNVTVTGTTLLTGVATFTAAPVFSAATASQAVFTNGSKALVSNAITGTGNVVMSASPTLTGTIAGAAMTLSSTLGVTGATTLSSTLAVTGVTTLTGGLNTPLVPAQGGTGLSSYAVGDLVYASGSTTLAKLADVAVGQVLVSGGVATAPAYSASPSITALTYTTNLKSTTALATPAALTATQATAFASTVSGSAIMGFGTTNDVSLMNRAGTVVLGIGPNTTTVNMTGLLSVSGLGTHNFSAGGTNGNTLNVVNTTSGTANYAELAVIAGTTNFYVDSFSQGYSTSATAIASSARLLTDGSGGLSIAATHASGTIRFYSGGTTERMSIGTTGRVRMPEVYNVTGTGAALYIESDGNLFRIVSARRYKDNIHYDNVNGDAVYALKPVSYTLKALGNSVEQIGFIAEDVEEIEPRLVVYSKEGTVDALHYERVTVLLVKAIQNLKANYDATISKLAARIAALETKDN